MKRSKGSIFLIIILSMLVTNVNAGHRRFLCHLSSVFVSRNQAYQKDSALMDRIIADYDSIISKSGSTNARVVSNNETGSIGIYKAEVLFNLKSKLKYIRSNMGLFYRSQDIFPIAEAVAFHFEILEAQRDVLNLAEYFKSSDDKAQSIAKLHQNMETMVLASADNIRNQISEPSELFLSSFSRELIHKAYQLPNNQFTKVLESISKTDPTSFEQSLSPLMPKDNPLIAMRLLSVFKGNIKFLEENIEKAGVPVKIYADWQEVIHGIQRRLLLDANSSLEKLETMDFYFEDFIQFGRTIKFERERIFPETTYSKESTDLLYARVFLALFNNLNYTQRNGQHGDIKRIEYFVDDDIVKQMRKIIIDKEADY